MSCDDCGSSVTDTGYYTPDPDPNGDVVLCAQCKDERKAAGK